MVSTDSHELMDKIWSYKDHGKTINSIFHLNINQVLDGFMIGWVQT